MKNWKIRIEFKLEDLWVGLFWKSKWQMTPLKMDGGHSITGYERSSFDLWICLIPCVPIHLNWTSPTAYVW
jgi:hypothetical protein